MSRRERHRIPPTERPEDILTKLGLAGGRVAAVPAGPPVTPIFEREAIANYTISFSVSTEFTRPGPDGEPQGIPILSFTIGKPDGGQKRWEFMVDDTILRWLQTTFGPGGNLIVAPGEIAAAVAHMAKEGQ